MRRESNFDVTDRIKICMSTSERVQKSYRIHQAYIDQEVLAIDMTFATCEGVTWDLNDETAIISLERVPLEKFTAESELQGSKDL